MWTQDEARIFINLTAQRYESADGLILPDDRNECGWRVASPIMLTWLADEVVKAVRAEDAFENWLRDKEIEGILSKGERDALKKTMKGAADFLGKGAQTIIDALAKGFFTEMGKQLVGK